MRNQGYLLLFLTWCTVFITACTESNSLPTAPDVEFQMIDGERIVLSELRGQPVLINFWSINCPVCNLERPRLQALYQHYNPLGLQMIAQAMPYDRPDQIVEFIRTQKFSLPVALDIDARVLNSFKNIPGTPTTILVDPNGAIVFQHSGPTPMEDLSKLLDKLLVQQTSEPVSN